MYRRSLSRYGPVGCTCIIHFFRARQKDTPSALSPRPPHLWPTYPHSSPSASHLPAHPLPRNKVHHAVAMLRVKCAVAAFSDVADHDSVAAAAAATAVSGRMAEAATPRAALLLTHPRRKGPPFARERGRGESTGGDDCLGSNATTAASKVLGRRVRGLASERTCPSLAPCPPQAPTVRWARPSDPHIPHRSLPRRPGPTLREQRVHGRRGSAETLPRTPLLLRSQLFSSHVCR